MIFRTRLRAARTLLVCACILLAGAWLASAGDLTPPAGPVAPTHKTLTEVEPRIAVNAANTAAGEIIRPGHNGQHRIERELLTLRPVLQSPRNAATKS